LSTLTLTNPSAVVFHIADLRPNVLNASVVDARSRQCYRIVMDAPQQPQRTVYYDNHRRTVVLIDWTGVRPSVEMPGLLPRQALRSWLHTGPDRAIMEIRGISHIWFPDEEYICLYYANRSSRCLGRICLTHNAVRIEPSQHAMEAGLAEVCILSASIFLDQTGLPVDWPCMLIYFLKIYVFNRSW